MGFSSDHLCKDIFVWAFQVLAAVKNPPANARVSGDSGSIPGSGRSPGGGNGNPLQYSCLENSTDRGAWQGYSPWGLKRVRHDWAHSMHAHTFLFISPKSTLTEKFQCIWTFDTKETILSLPFASHPHVLLHGLHIVGVHHSTASKPFPYLQLRTILCQATEGVVIWLIGFLPDYARLSPPGSASSPVSSPQRWARAPSPWNPPHFPPSLLIFFSPLPSSVRTK